MRSCSINKSGYKILHVEMCTMCLHLRTILKKKNDQKGKGTHILLPTIHQCNICCPVSNLKNFLSVRPCVEGSFFVHCDKSPSLDSSFTRSWEKLFWKKTHPISAYKLHSFRIGGATCLVLKGVSHAKIKLLGQWKSSAFLKYIRIDMM